MDTVMAEPTETQALVKRARCGDRVAFDELAAQSRSSQPNSLSNRETGETAGFSTGPPRSCLRISYTTAPLISSLSLKTVPV